MKKIIFLICIALMFHDAFSQNAEKLKRNYSIKNKARFEASWIAKSDGYQIQLKTDITQLIFDKDLSTDIIRFKITSFKKEGREIGKSFNRPIEILYMAYDGQRYRGSYKDPLTGNNLYFYLRLITDRKIELTAKLHDFDIYNDNRKGTTFPKGAMVFEKI